jgi:DNA-directed RNA polymerase sigma subunit (sigma70/sigma32)
MQRFLFHPSSQHTFKKIGEELGISAEAVRQIEKKALNKISKSRDELANCVYA